MYETKRSREYFKSSQDEDKQNISKIDGEMYQNFLSKYIAA